MTWRHWKRGLLIAILTGLATGAIGLAAGITWAQAGVILLACIGKDLMLYLQKNPLETIDDTAYTIRRASRSASHRPHPPTDLRGPAAPQEPPTRRD